MNVMVTRRKALLLILIALFTVVFGFFINGRKRRENRSAIKNLESYRDLIEDISETIIPVTDTPGARDAQVSNYIINVIERCTTSRDRLVILQGLNQVQQYSFNNFSKSFQTCAFKDKTAILRHFERKGNLPHPFLNKVRRKLFGLTFFEQIKGLTVSGYCTSKLGATVGLAYDHVPTKYVPCLPYAPNQRSWATN